LIDFAIAYFAKLKESTVGRGRTSCFDDIEATKVVLRILNYTLIGKKDL
jgi:hypothetical protein